jgi:hypothetical protein
MTTNAIYEKRGTTVTFTEAGVGDKALIAANTDLAQVAGTVSAFVDRGATAAPGEYEVRAYCKWEATVTVNENAQIYLCQSDGTHTDAGITYDATNPAALTLVKCSNLKMIGIVNAAVADTNEHGATFVTRITSRYFAIGVYNSSAAKDLLFASSETLVAVTPIFPDVQTAG